VETQIGDYHFLCAVAKGNPLTTRRLVTWIAFLAVFTMAARISMDTDTWWHLRAGQWIMEHGLVPQADPFSYTRLGAVWQYPGWLVEVPMLWLYRLLGPGGLNLWTAAMVTLAFAFLWRALSGGPFLKAFVVVLAATASGVYWAARPYLVTFLRQRSTRDPGGLSLAPQPGQHPAAVVAAGSDDPVG
jgi:hypothetical protein